jgi:hypothetical protein
MWQSAKDDTGALPGQLGRRQPARKPRELKKTFLTFIGYVRLRNFVPRLAYRHLVANAQRFKQVS